MDAQLLECGHHPTPTTHGGTGYGTDEQGNRSCYACCAEDDERAMIETGKATLYLTVKVTPEEQANGFRRWFVTNWPGSLSFLVGGAIRYGRHNIAGTRKDVWFRGPDGKEWHGVQYGENTQICHCHRLAKQPAKYEYHLLANYGHGDGWEHEVTEQSISEIREQARTYRENCPGVPVKWRKRKVQDN